MVRQILLLKFKPEFFEAQILELFAEWQKLANIPGVISIETGKNINGEGYDKGFTHAAIVTFESTQSVEKYLYHPTHIAFAEEKFNDSLQDLIIIDISLEVTKQTKTQQAQSVPHRDEIKVGQKVWGIEKKNYASGVLTEGIVAQILTSKKFHPRGVKVKFQDGTVARVQKIAPVLD